MDQIGSDQSSCQRKLLVGNDRTPDTSGRNRTGCPVRFRPDASGVRSFPNGGLFVALDMVQIIVSYCDDS